ncbi:methyl-accepting chemotaxis protein [Paenibacillus cremeus]|uniref:Methyl-accepting chemotaxis protein n=1 Tax=Paenibacillus cremeus TaxID=2163881 RepID=A0A559KIJ8_9BACL|nr:methyl-accepting chemotaxis protein [Paenibacillus cremeus]TVY11964.1 methyl-accepting chemotaxis protein [Paenibacillus cremeus]
MKEKLSSLKASLQKAGQAMQSKSNQPSEKKSPNGMNGAEALKSLGLQNVMKSVGIKLFIIFFVSILFFVLTVGLTSYNISKGVIQNKVGDASEQTIIQAGQKLDLLYATYEDLSMQIMLDEDLKKMLNELDNVNKSSYDFLQLRQKINDKMNVFSYSNKTIKSLNIFKGTGEPITTGTGGFAKETYAQEDWFKRTLDANGRATWNESRSKGFGDSGTAGGAPTFALTRVLKSPSSNTIIAVLLMEINIDAVAKELGDINMGEGGKTVILSANQKLVYSKEQGMIGSDASLGVADTAYGKDHDHMLNEKKDNQLVYFKSAKNGWLLVGAMPVDELVKDAKKISMVTWWMAFFATIIAVVIGFFVARMIGGPMIMLRNLMKDGEQGNLRVRMNVKTQDEIGQLGHSFNSMMEKITLLVQQTNNSAQEVLNTAIELSNASKQTATSAKEIAVATEEIAGGASSLASESERGNELTHNIGVQMKNVVNANISMGTSASDVQKSSEQGITYMSELIGKTNSTEAMTRSMVEKVDNLKESTRSIRKILDVLGNMTKQTNILSLNATIEAARAGTAGKGFMVVADEIRKLADQSRQSISVVGDITDTIQKEIDETVKVLSQAYPIFQEQISSVKEADSIFKQVQTHMGGFITQLSEVTESISELEASQVVLNEAMTNVSAVAQQSSATSEEVASLSSEQLGISSGLVRLSDKLEELSNSLKESLSKFQV